MADNFFGLTDTGRVRDNNEDAFIAQPIGNGRYILACVIDGVGGYAGGEVAAAITRQSILDDFTTVPGDWVAQMRRAFITANQKVYAEKLQVREYDSMACVLTMAVVDVENNLFHYAHVGDTRLYLLRDDTLVKVTKDHSFVGFLEDTGRLTEEAAMNHPKRNEINKAIGFGGEINTQEEYIETGQSPFLPGDMLLLCSDGLSDLVNKSEMTAILRANRSLAEKCTKLVAAANAKGGKDNITVVLVCNDKAPLLQEATRPAEVVKKNEEPPAAAAPIIPPVKETGTTPKSKPRSQPKPKSSRGIITILSLLCLAFLGTTLYLLWQNVQNEQTQKKSDQPAPDPQQIKLQQAINTFTGDTLYLADTTYAQPIRLTSMLRIDRDSLYIKAPGNILLTGDSTYSEPAIRLSAQCRYIVLDNLTLEGFQVGISAPNSALHLKNVRFRNCQVPVQTQFLFSDNQYVNGPLPVTLFRTDSVPVVSSKVVKKK
ncbi:protein phosphatase 2C domain-containing protein [Nibrella saemangeumensis]